MARPGSEHPTELELIILRIIWRNGPSTARAVQNALTPTRPLAFTSILTTMNIMVKKGYLGTERRPKSKGGTIYSAKVAEASTASNMLGSLAKRLFGGSLATAIQNLISAGEINPGELKELRKIVNETERDPK